MTHDPITLFLEAVKKAGLADEPTLQSLSQEIRADGAGSQEEVAATLVERKVLTPYQAERLLLGEGEDCVLAGRYHLLEKIGAGGMGSVFRAKDTKLDRVVAVKLMAAHNLSDADAVARFKREARALAQLALPNVVQAFDTGDDRGRNFLVMEFVKGTSLDRLVRDRGKLPPTVAADYIYQTAVGMQQAHERGLIHRDLKPANLLLTSAGQVKILDLGLARFLQDQIPASEVTRDNIGMGTPDYMAPEQFRDAHRVDARADVYSLGCTLYYLIAGIVPFPGSSFSEKAHAHENKEPPPLEERSPEIPAGLSLAAAKMLAKRPADRYQNMRAVAEALAPYVAGSSPALPSIKQTVSYHGTQIETMRQHGRRSAVAWFLGGAAAVALVTFLAVGFLSNWWRGTESADDQQLAGNNGDPPHGNNKTGNEPEPGPSKGKSNPPNNGDKKEPDPAPPKLSPNTLTVAQDGTGQFKTINAALDKVKPGQTIRVLDNAFYDEQVLINDPGKHSGITLEAAKGALLELQTGTKFALKVHAVPFVSVKGFRCQAKGSVEEVETSVVMIEGRAPGVTISDLTIKSHWKVVGVAVFAAPLQPGDAPIVVRNCQIDVGRTGIVAAGHGLVPTKRVLIQDNRITAPRGINVELVVADIQISGNLIWECGLAGVELRRLGPGSHGILLANNTVFRAQVGLRIWDEPSSPQGKGFHFEKGQVALVNNVLCQPKAADMILFRAAPQAKKGMPKDSTFLLDLWTFTGNWRELGSGASEPITPLAPGDHKLEGDPFLSTVPGQAQFLQPKKDSPLANSGVGKNDVAFPAYAGAVPPEGATHWNWQWTWDAFFDKILTVSQDAKDQARYQSINAALDKVKPAWTVRVLDKGDYEEQINIVDPERHKGITLEAVNGATITLDKAAPYALKIEDVAQITVKGLRFKSENHAKDQLTENYFNGLIQVKTFAAGTRLEGLTLQTTDKVGGIRVEKVTHGPTDLPLVISGCTVKVEGIGIILVGTNEQPTSRVMVKDNFVQASKGISLGGGSKHILLAGNMIKADPVNSLELQDTFPVTEKVLVANNTLYGGAISLRFWEEHPLTKIPKHQLAFRGNVLFGAKEHDIGFYKKAPGQPLAIADSKPLLDLCLFEHNWRNYASFIYGQNMPLAPGDHKLKGNEFISLNPAGKDFLRPKKDSPLASEGAGKEDPDLPAYVGAIPPEGVEAWDWDKTWKAKFERR